MSVKQRPWLAHRLGAWANLDAYPPPVGPNWHQCGAKRGVEIAYINWCIVVKTGETLFVTNYRGMMLALCLFTKRTIFVTYMTCIRVRICPIMAS